MVQCFLIKTNAQKVNNYYFQFFNASHGLPSSEIIALAKDKNGFLWIGTSAGLSQYDGYEFHNYSYAKDGSLIGYINTLVFDEQGRLWIGSSSGLFCKITNDVIKISESTLLPQGVNDILLQKDGTIWLATENGPAKINIKDIDFNTYKKLFLSNYILPQWKLGNEQIDSRRVLHIAKATDGTIYFSQLLKLFRLSQNKLDVLFNMSNKNDHILSIFPINKNKVFYNCVETEIHVVENNIHKNIQHKILYKPGVDNSLDGIWYQGSYGIYYFHPQTGVASTFINTLEQGIIWPSTMLKEDNFFWVASHHGLAKIKPSIFTVYNLKNIKNVHDDFYSFIHLKNGDFLLGSNRGEILKRHEEKINFLWKKLVPTAEIKCLYESDDGWLWAGTGYQGLVLIKNKKIKVFTVADGLHDNSILNFIKTSNGKLYAICDQGLSEIIIDKYHTISFKKYYHQPTISQHARFFSGIDGPDNTIWLGSEEGLFKLENDSLIKYNISPKQISVKYIVKDKNGMVWVATDGEGILQCAFNDKNELNIIKKFTEKDGLNSLHYLNLLVDKDNNIWAGSSKGISFIGQTKKYKGRVLNFDESDGFIKPGYFSINMYEDKEGVIWAGTTFGFASFKPDELFLSSNNPTCFISSVTELANNKTLILSNVENNNGINSDNKFRYDHNSFNFTFTALDYANQQSIQYFYKLEGLDSNWINGEKTRSVRYENLAPGKYLFKVKAQNSKAGESNNNRFYRFEIIAPFWYKWWFLAIASAVIFLITYAIIKWRETNIKKTEYAKTEIEKLKVANYQYQLEIEKVINYFATTISSQITVEEMLWDVAKKCISQLGFEDCVIYLKDETKNTLVQKAAWGPKNSSENKSNHQIDKIINAIEIPMGKGIVGAVGASGKAEIIANTSTDDRYIEDDAKRFSEIAVPLIINGKTVGVIDSEHPQLNFYTQRHMQILTTIAALCADKIDKINAEQQTRQKEIEVLRLNKDLATSQLIALRAQMNPHFIFNALNSVQQYILTGDVDQANKYLSKFSRLQRAVLNHCDQNFIALDKEIEMLQLYLELEQLRLKENFEYSINISTEIDTGEIKIPPMILQPFVENAIWHGLMPKEGNRQVQINFTVPSYNYLQCIIKDNGIGRDAAAKIKLQGNKSINHKSKGLGLVYERLQVLQQQYQQSFTVYVKDIVLKNGKIEGTEVLLNIFIGY